MHVFSICCLSRCEMFASVSVLCPYEVRRRNCGKADNWRPLIAIADAFGPCWAAGARRAAVAFAGEHQTRPWWPATAPPRTASGRRAPRNAWWAARAPPYEDRALLSEQVS
jgi:hypothetical protein